MPIESSPCISIASAHFSSIRGTSTLSRAICSPRSTPKVGCETAAAGMEANDCEPTLLLEG